ncbi:MAG: alpha/beta hydrolase [Ruminococcus sp.]|nr:alpha/beta hydrolase [Ruminococcus sp.]
MNYKNIVRVNGHGMNVFHTGSGADTLVFLAGAAVTAPVLEYKPLWSRLSETFRIAVPEKLGYGFSDSDTGSPRDVETMVNQTREALLNAGIKPPYILVPHSYSGTEAVYWANTYTSEIKAILGLDMVTPGFALAQAEELPEDKKRAMVERNEKLYRKISSSRLLQKLLRKQTVEATGVLKSGALDDEEKKLYCELFYKNLCNGEISSEQLLATSNAETAEKTGKLKVPAHMFISDMKTPLKKTSWLAENTAFAKENGISYETAKSHFYYAEAPDIIAGVWRNFIKAL